MALPQKLHNPVDQSGRKGVKQKTSAMQKLREYSELLGGSSSDIMAPQKDDIWKEIMKQFNALHPPREPWKRVKESGLI